MWLWHPELSEIEAWFETKVKEFAETKNKNTNHDSEAWLRKYIYSDIHKVFFATFPSELHSWVERLADSTGYVRSDRPAQWNQAAVQRLKNTNNAVSRAVDFWLTSLLLGFITEFTVDTLKAYTDTKRQFFKCYRGKFLNSLNLWIKILLCDKGVLQLRLDL